MADINHKNRRLYTTVAHIDLLKPFNKHKDHEYEKGDNNDEFELNGSDKATEGTGTTTINTSADPTLQQPSTKPGKE